MTFAKTYLAEQAKQRRETQALATALKTHLGVTINTAPSPPRTRTGTTRGGRLALTQLLTQRDGNHCYLCRKELQPHATIIEHIIPKSRGGTDDAYNLGLACTSCNAIKCDNYVSLDVSSGRPRYHPA